MREHGFPTMAPWQSDSFGLAGAEIDPIRQNERRLTDDEKRSVSDLRESARRSHGLIEGAAAWGT